MITKGKAPTSAALKGSEELKPSLVGLDIFHEVFVPVVCSPCTICTMNVGQTKRALLLVGQKAADHLENTGLTSPVL